MQGRSQSCVCSPQTDGEHSVQWVQCVVSSCLFESLAWVPTKVEVRDKVLNTRTLACTGFSRSHWNSRNNLLVYARTSACACHLSCDPLVVVRSPFREEHKLVVVPNIDSAFFMPTWKRRPPLSHVPLPRPPYRSYWWPMVLAWGNWSILPTYVHKYKTSQAIHPPLSHPFCMPPLIAAELICGSLENVYSLALLRSHCLLLWFYQNRTVPLPVTSGTLFQGLFSHFFRKNHTTWQVVLFIFSCFSGNTVCFFMPKKQYDLKSSTFFKKKYFLLPVSSTYIKAGKNKQYCLSSSTSKKRQESHFL